MAEIMDVQARDDISKEMLRAKQAESNLGFDIEILKRELEDLKQALLGAKEPDSTPIRDSENLITSGGVYSALMSLEKKINVLR